jgi:hypothetical protein
VQAIMTIGLDIAKSVFQVHGIDAEGNVILRRRVKRRHALAFFQKLPPRLVGYRSVATLRAGTLNRSKSKCPSPNARPAAIARRLTYLQFLGPTPLPWNRPACRWQGRATEL